MKQSKYIFIDEFGNPDLNIEKGGTQPYLIYAAVVIDENELDNAKQVLRIIHDKYFPQNRYLKSKQINNSEKGYVVTVNILTELKRLKHYVYAVVVDKKNLDSKSGLAYKDVFIKYFNGLIARHLYNEDVDTHVCFDKTGWPEFQKELCNYMERKGWGPTLFSNNTYTLSDDQTEEPLLQIADFYAGIFGKYYCGKYDENRSKVIHDGFIRKISIIDWFPRTIVPMFAADAAFDSNYNKEITRIAIASAESYLNTHSNDIVGCELIRYVLQETRRNPMRLISSKEIKTNLKARNVEIGDPIVKISELRDEGVLLISPIGKKGYKIPNNEQEIAEFYNRLIGNVQPQLKRCYLLNKVLFEKSNGNYNILSSYEFELLSRLCDMVVLPNPIVHDE